MSSHKISHNPPSVWTLFLLLSFPTVAGVFFTPSIPAIMHTFSLTKKEVSLGITAFLFFYAVAQLFYAPIANLAGRKNALYSGITLACISALLAALAQKVGFWLLLVARSLQGMGAAVGLNITFTIINDVYKKKQARKILPIVCLSFATLPFFAMFLSGVITTVFSWTAVFYAFFLYGIFLLWRVHALPETYCSISAKQLNTRKILAQYKKGFSDPRLMLYGLLFGCTTAMLYLFAATAPILVVEKLGYSPFFYGLLSLIPSLGYVTGNLVARGLSHFFAPRTVIFYGMLCIFFATCTLQWYSTQLNLSTLFLPIYFIYLGIPLSHTNASFLATTHFQDRSCASSIMSFSNVMFAFLHVQIIRSFPQCTFIHAFFILLGFMLILFFLSRKFD